MGLETAAADHACNVVRRQVQEEFPDLTLMFMVHQPGQRQKAFDTKRSEIRQHPAAEAFLPHLKQAIEKGGPEFSGISIKAERKFLRFMAREKILACFFVDAGKLDSTDEARRHALFLAFQSLSLMEDYKNGKKDFFQEAAGIIVPHPDKKVRSWKNMLADAFLVLMLEIEKRRDSIGILGRARSTATLTANAGSKPEYFPFPLVLDATRLVYHDMAKTMTPGNPVKQALEMTREIGETFDISSVRQWWAFSRTAQEMAWLGAEPNAILGAAIYNSEDPYARATAYLVVEALNIQNPMQLAAGLYNPFADPEVTVRHHLKACEEKFRNVLSKAAAQSSSAPFLEEAEKQNKKLLGGQPLGWCAYPLLCAEMSFRSGGDNGARQTFNAALAKVSWQNISDIMSLVVLLRRRGTEVTDNLLAEKLQEINDLKFLAPCFIK